MGLSCDGFKACDRDRRFFLLFIVSNLTSFGKQTVCTGFLIACPAGSSRVRNSLGVYFYPIAASSPIFFFWPAMACRLSRQLGQDCAVSCFIGKHLVRCLSPACLVAHLRWNRKTGSFPFPVFSFLLLLQPVFYLSRFCGDCEFDPRVVEQEEGSRTLLTPLLLLR